MNSYFKAIATLLILLAMPLATALAAQKVQVKSVDGSRQQGNLVAWDAIGITLQTDNGQLTINSTEILSLSSANALSDKTAEHTFLNLIDGTRLPHDGFNVKERFASVTTPLAAGTLTLSTEMIDLVQLMPQSPEVSEQDLVGDRIVIFKKKSGTYDSLDGVLGDVTAEQVRFTWDGDTIPVKRAKVAAIAYFHAKPPELPDPICWLNLANGARLPVAAINLKAEIIEVVTTSELRFAVPLSSMQQADYSGGKLVYLSDLTPSSQRWTPRIDLPATAELIQQYGLPRIDQSFTGSAISLLWPHPKTGIVGGEIKSYDKGLALRSRTDCRYRVPKGMTRFVTTAGIDPQTAEQGHVTLEIFADKQSIWQGEIAGGVDPVEINVTLGKARMLRLVVDFGENLDFGDRLHLSEARVTK